MSQVQTTKLSVSGMTCGHCAGSVTEELEGLTGVRSVRVELEPGATSAVFVDSEGPLDLPGAKAAVAEAGYTVVG